jgi:hypothetical protein
MKTKIHSRLFGFESVVVVVAAAAAAVVSGIDDELVFLVECSIRFVSF